VTNLLAAMIIFILGFQLRGEIGERRDNSSPLAKLQEEVARLRSAVVFLTARVNLNPEERKQALLAAGVLSRDPSTETEEGAPPSRGIYRKPAFGFLMMDTLMAYYDSWAKVGGWLRLSSGASGGQGSRELVLGFDELATARKYVGVLRAYTGTLTLGKVELTTLEEGKPTDAMPPQVVGQGLDALLQFLVASYGSRHPVRIDATFVPVGLREHGTGGP